MVATAAGSVLHALLVQKWLALKQVLAQKKKSFFLIFFYCEINGHTWYMEIHIHE
jgi:hypothetical protein